MHDGGEEVPLLFEGEVGGNQHGEIAVRNPDGQRRLVVAGRGAEGFDDEGLAGVFGAVEDVAGGDELGFDGGAAGDLHQALGRAGGQQGRERFAREEGLVEVPPFDVATMAAAQHAADLAKAGKLVAVAGGGDTVAALNAAGRADDFTFVSTAGGAFLEWMEGKELPGVAALTN